MLLEIMDERLLTYSKVLIKSATFKGQLELYTGHLKDATNAI